MMKILYIYIGKFSPTDVIYADSTVVMVGAVNSGWDLVAPKFMTGR